MSLTVLYSRCAGLDVHKKTVVACVLLTAATGRLTKEVRTFATTTAGLLALREWLSSQGVTHVAMESTGVYWRPVFNILEGHCEVILVNAQHMKAVPGHKTDIKDSEWIADLLRHGLLRASFIPPKPIRDLRDLLRTRKALVRNRAQAINRVHKVLETANIKLSSVASDVLGKSGRDMLDAMLEGVSDAEALAQFARKRLRAKLPALREALEGRVEETHASCCATYSTRSTSCKTSWTRSPTRSSPCLLPTKNSWSASCRSLASDARQRPAWWRN